jgi:DNA-binding transcriptional MerR regulator
MQLKVGELARATGLTVRTLHHYDEIGLLKPSGRSESGYRLYDEADVARLHGIQALRQMGLPLADIADLLAGRGAPPQAIIEQQMRAIDSEIVRATELRERLALIRGQLAKGDQPDLQSWLRVLQDMATYGKYFSADELKTILSDFAPFKQDWARLFADVQSAMDRRLAPDAPEVQSLARRWMSLMLGWMKGDYEKMERWGRMYESEPGRIRQDAPPPELVAFIRRAIDLRWTVMQRHFSRDELERLRHVPESEWQAVESEVRGLIARGVDAARPEAKPCAGRWLALLDEMTGGDRPLRDKLLRLAVADPVMAAGSPFSPPVRDWLRTSLTARA